MNTAVLAVVLVIAPTLAGCAGDDGREEVRVAAAASLAEVVEGLAGLLRSAEEPLVVEADLAGSSTLAQQLLDGSPADVFLSADEATMDAVVDGGRAEGEVVTFATNGLVLVVPDGNPGGISGLEDLARSELLIGRCAPEVPCGRLAVAELEEAGVTDASDTEETDVRGLLAKVRAGELDAALVYETDAVAAGDDVEVVRDRRLDRRNRYQAVRVAGGDRDAADRFLTALRGPAGAGLLAARGFGSP